MVHGLAGSKEVWHWNFHAFPSFRCIVPDLPGNGISANLNKRYTIQHYTEALIHFLDELGITKVHWFGHSMGGQIALYAAIHYPERLQTLILSSPAGFEYFTPLEVQLLKHGIMMNPFLNLDHWLLQELYKSSFFLQEEKSKALFRKIKEMTHGRDQTDYVRMLKESMIGMLEEQLFHKLKHIRHDTLVFFGEYDQMIPNAMLHSANTTKQVATKACQELRHSHLIMFPDAGHFPHIEKHEQVNKLVADWLHRKSSE